MGTDRSGVTAREILQAARRHGLRAQGVRLSEFDDLERLPTGSILHWEFRHFVVFEKVEGGALYIMDPAFGRRRISASEFDEACTGVALRLVPGEDFQTNDDAARPMWSYVRRFLGYPALWGRVLLMSVIVQVLAVSLPLLTMLIVDHVIPRRDFHLLSILGAGLAVMVAFHFVSALVRADLLLRLRTLLDAKASLEFLEHLVALPYAFFQNRSAGDLLMRLDSHSTIRELVTSGAMSAVLDGTLVGAYLVLIVGVSPAMAAVVVGLAAAQIIVAIATRRTQRELTSEGLAVQARAASYQVEVLTGVESLKSMGAEYRAVDRWSNLFVDALNVSLRSGRLDALVSALLGALELASPLLVLGTGTALVLAGELSLGTMLGLAAVGAGFLSALSTLVGEVFRLQVLGSYLERIDDVMQTEREQDGRRVEAPHLGGGLEVRDVVFGYGRTPVLRGVCMRARPGQFLAIVGESGAGKSTLAKVLVGLHRPQTGQVFYDGLDLATLDLRSVREQLGVVTQEAELFATSVRDNIALGRPEATLDEIVEAARAAEVHEVIAALPMGYETVLSDGGRSLSGGERQRIVLARALVRKPALLLLDEATSHLDTATERAIERTLSSLSCTRVVIAHRLSTVVKADEIVVMGDGRVVERGTHAELIAAGTVYRTLYARCDG